MPLFRSVLVVDDEASIRHVLSLVLTDHGYEVRAVSDGAEALRELNARPYDVVISDVRMPKVDGMALLKTTVEKWPDITYFRVAPRWARYSDFRGETPKITELVLG